MMVFANAGLIRLLTPRRVEHTDEVAANKLLDRFAQQMHLNEQRRRLRLCSSSNG
jgi:hypothetical protein